MPFFNEWRFSLCIYLPNLEIELCKKGMSHTCTLHQKLKECSEVGDGEGKCLPKVRPGHGFLTGQGLSPHRVFIITPRADE